MCGARLLPNSIPQNPIAVNRLLVTAQGITLRETAAPYPGSAHMPEAVGEVEYEPRTLPAQAGANAGAFVSYLPLQGLCCTGIKKILNTGMWVKKMPVL